MAIDDTPPSDGPKPIERPNRERHREPWTIEGKAERLGEEPEAAPAAEAEEAAPADEPAPLGEDLPPPPSEPQAPEPRRSGQPVALAAALLALVVSGGTAFYAWERGTTPAAAPGDVADLRSRLDRVESAASRPAASPDQLAALERRMQSLEQRPAPQLPAQAAPPPPASGAPAPALATLQSRLDAVERLARQAASEAAERPAPAAAPPPPPPPPAVDLGPLESRIAAVEATLAAPKTEVRAKEDPVAAPRKGDPTALAVVAEALASAVERGRPFALELAAAESLGVDPSELASLKPLADKGAPSRESLSRAFAQVSSKVLAAAEPAAASDSLIDRLSASATRLVRVRPVGETGGEDAPSLVARIEAANARGDAAAAQHDWDRLPDAAKSASAAYGDLLRKKVAAEQAARTILDGAMSALARPKD